MQKDRRGETHSLTKQSPELIIVKSENGARIRQCAESEIGCRVKQIRYLRSGNGREDIDPSVDTVAVGRINGVTHGGVGVCSSVDVGANGELYISVPRLDVQVLPWVGSQHWGLWKTHHRVVEGGGGKYNAQFSPWDSGSKSTYFDFDPFGTSSERRGAISSSYI